MEQLGIIELVKEVTEWVNIFVIMERKDGNSTGCRNNEKFLQINQLPQQIQPMFDELSDPLREIYRQKMEFKLTKASEVAFQCCKMEISKNITLPYFNPKASMIL